MRTSDFDYFLPHHLIAQTPVEPRDHSRLMVLRRGDRSMEHHLFFEIGEFLQPGDVLVFNDSRVIPAHLLGQKEKGGKVEILLLHRQEEGAWEALTRPARRMREGDQIEIVPPQEASTGCPSGSASLVGEVLEKKEGGVRVLRFSDESLLEKMGQIPLPPYIHTPLRDPERYQTVYARVKGSAAAPTAGLHFTPELLLHLAQQGVELAFVTLHIGLDTFRPVREGDPRQHFIHKEYGEITGEVAQRLNTARKEGRRIVSMGTTTTRILEQAAFSTSGEVRPFRGWADLFILPGHQFRVVDALVTNFHLPRSTLLMLVSAFAGKELIERAYREAIAQGYRFYSFGDCMLVS